MQQQQYSPQQVHQLPLHQGGGLTQVLSPTGLISPGSHSPLPGVMSPIVGAQPVGGMPAQAEQIPYGQLNVPRGMEGGVPPGSHIAALAAQRMDPASPQPGMVTSPTVVPQPGMPQSVVVGRLEVLHYSYRGEVWGGRRAVVFLS